MKTQHKQLLATAYHEAGHAVAAIGSRQRFRYATIIPGEDNLGHVLYRPLKNFEPDALVESKTMQRIDLEVLDLLAGFAAEWRHTGRRNLRGAASDFRNATDLASYLLDATDTIGKYIDYMVLRARDFVYVPAHWTQIEAVAHALFEHQRLSADRVRTVARESLAKPPTERR